jgi:hypothetical protein
LAFGQIDGGHIAIDSIDSIHYAALSIDNEHIANDTISLSKLVNISPNTIIANTSTTTTTNPTTLTAGSDGVLRRDGSGALAFGGLDRNHIIDGEITNSKLASGINADKITVGTVADARIASTITRDTELTAALGNMYGNTGGGGYWITAGTGAPNNGDGSPNGSIYLRYV